MKNKDYVDLDEVAKIESRLGFDIVRRQNGFREIAILGDLDETPKDAKKEKGKEAIPKPLDVAANSKDDIKNDDATIESPNKNPDVMAIPGMISSSKCYFSLK